MIFMPHPFACFDLCLSAHTHAHAYTCARILMHTHAVPSHAPTNLTYQSSSVVGDFIMISLSWSYPVPDSGNSVISCEENVIGYFVECKDVNSMVKLSQVTLAVSGSPDLQHQDFTAEVALSQDLGAVLSAINCTVAAFNAAGTGNSTEKLLIDLTGFFINCKHPLKRLQHML